MAKAATKPAQDNTPKSNTDGQTPWHRGRIGLMQIAGWENRHDDGEGERVFSTFTLKRSYRNKEGEWEESKMSLGFSDLGAAIALLQNAQQASVKID